MISLIASASTEDRLPFLLASIPHTRVYRAAMSAFILTLLLSSLCLPAPASAQASLEVLELGWDGTIVPGSWAPVRVRVRGPGPEVTALVEIVLFSRMQTAPGATIPVTEYAVAAYGEDVALPPGVTKELTIWFPPENNAAGQVRLSVAGRTLAEQRVEFRVSRTPNWPLVGALAESPLIARTLTQIEIPYQSLFVPIDVVDLASGDLPARSEHLSALNALVVQGDAATGLTGEQRRAVHGWVLDGGNLVLIGGPNPGRPIAVLPPDTLGVSFTGADAAGDLTPLLQWAGMGDGGGVMAPAARLRSDTGAVLAGTRDTPLVWRQGIGRGTVTILAVDPALEPLASSAATPVILRKLLESSLPTSAGERQNPGYFGLGAQSAAQRLSGVTSALPPEAFPSWQLVGIVLGGFALGAGLLGHLVLRLLNRREWVWVVVPAAAVLVSMVLYVVGIGHDGRDVLGHVVSYVQLDPERREAQQTLAAGFYAPTHGNLQVGVPGGGLVLANSGGGGPSPFGGMFAPGSLSGEPPVRVVQGREPRVEFTEGEWDMRSVILERSLGDEIGRIATRFTVENGVISGSLRNETPYRLEDAAVVIGESVQRVGDLAPGQTAPVSITPSFVRSSTPRSRQGVAAQLFTGPTPFGPPDEPEPRRRSALMNAALGAGEYGYAVASRSSLPGTGESLPLTVFAFTRNPVGPGVPSVGGRPAHHLTLLRQPARLEFGPGPFALPMGLVPAQEESGARGSGQFPMVQVPFVELRGNSTTFRFKLPLPATARVDSLAIATRQLGQTTSAAQSPPGSFPGDIPVPASEGVFQVYNWQTASWEPLPAGVGEARLEPAEAYVDREGQVRVEARSRAGSVVRVVPPDISVQGQVLG
jgi:hypothetical protein